MSTALLERPTVKVPAEFVGLARLYRNSVESEDKLFDRAVATITAPLRARLRRHPLLRGEQVAQAERLYARTVPSVFRFGVPLIAPDRAAFSIIEHRLTATLLHDDHWQDAENYNEAGVAVCRFSLALKDGRLRERWEPVAVVSFHALGRYYERSGRRDHAALLTALSVLLDAGDGDEVPAGDGLWIGSRVLMKGPGRKVTARSVRTYHW
jgi:hypothetical protein